jgi:hypothetical protein
MSHIRQEHHLFDDIDELKQGLTGKYSSSPSPSEFDPRSPIHQTSFSPGIPTPQSSLDSVIGLGREQPLVHGFGRPNFVPHFSSEMSDLSKLSATVEAATMASGIFVPPRSFSSSSASSS